MNEKSKQLYNYLKSNGLTDLDANTFFSKYSDPNKSKEVWSYLNQNGMTDLDANAFYDSYFKKKSPEGSGSGTSSSGRLSNTTTKPTASSSSTGEIFTGYPGKGDKPYQFKDGKWYEEAPVKVYGQKAQYVQIQDPNRIKNLNRQFGKDASLSQVEEVFSNYDEEKADNQYRIKDGQWQRMTPGSKWHTIQNEGSINALNNRYGKSVSTRVVTTTTVKPAKFDDINSDFMAKTEENAIKYLTEKYGKYGFEFSEEGLFAIDQIRVKTKDGSKDKVFEFDEKNPEQARELRAFLEVNASKSYSENFDKALNSLNKGDIEIKPQTGGSTFAFGTDQSSYEKESAAIRGKNLLSNEFQSNFKKLPFDEQKELIQKQIAGGNISSKDVQSFYKSEAYKDYKKKKIEGDQQVKAKQDQIFDDYQYALATKDPARIKEAKAKINAYYTDDIIQDNVKTYNMKLNDLEQTQKNILQDRKVYDEEVSRFNQLAESGKMTQEQYDAQKKILDSQAESLETRAQNLVMQKKEIIASQNKLNLVTGKYIAAKEKEGSLGGFLVNKVLTGISMTFAEPFAALEATDNRYDYLSPEEKAYYKSIKHNGKNLTKEQIENLLDNQAVLKAKNQAKQNMIDVLGSEGTTLEYMKSGDRGFITQAIGGVLESLPAMATGIAGKAAGFTGLALQAYSGIEEEMLSDPDFQYTSAGDRAIIAIPYAAGMGVLENVGLQNLVKGDSFLGKVMMDVAIKSAKKVGANATKEALERVAAKEVESLLAKGLIRVTQAGVAEFETGFTQALVLDQGLKKAYNLIQQSGMTEEQKKKLTQGEFFDTADTLKELGSKTFEDGVAEMIGGFAMGSVGTLLQAVVKGNVSLYNEDDVKFLNDVVADSNFKKLYVASLKTQMLDGKITKSKAQQNIDNLNEIEAAFDMMPNGLSTADMNRSLSLITERAQLTKEKAGKDPNLVAPIEARIKSINEELTKIGENAFQKQATGEVPVQSGAAISGKVEERKPETGLKETTQKGKEEVNQYIADMGADARIGSTINPLMDKMANAEYINDNDIDNAIEAIFNEVESLDKSDYSAETKAALSDKLLNIAEKLDNYEFRTKTETVATTKAGAATTTRRTSEAVQKIRAEKYFDGVQATVNGQEVTLKDNNGRVEAQMPSGEVVVLDTPTMEIAEDGFEFDDSDALVAVTVTDRLGNTARLTGDQALDFAIRDRENKLGVVEQAEFDTVYQEVEKKYIKENLQDKQKGTNLAQDEKGKPKAGNRLFNEPLKAVAEIANRYFQRVFGSQRPTFEGTTDFDVERAKRIAAAYEAMENNPNDPEVKRAYEAMAKETIDQYQDFLDAGYVVEINNEEPYATSEEMIEDLRNNKRIKIFSTESGFGDEPITPKQRAENPLLATTEFTDVNGQPMLVNDLFRAVHDFFGHAELGNSFGPKGEENAWNVHARMYSPLARRAMTTETRGQNSYVNFSGVNEDVDKLREQARKLREEGKIDEAAAIVNQIYDDAKFAEQKIGLLPEEFSIIDGETETQKTGPSETNLFTERNAKVIAVKFPKKKAIIRAALNVIKALPGVKIYLHENSDQYAQELAARTGETKQSIASEKSAGSYIDGEIHLDMSKADLVTLLHEAFHHAFLTLGVKNGMFIDLAKGLRPLIRDKARLAELDEFIQSYTEETDQETLELRAEEFAAQLGGILAANQEELTTTKLTQFKALINRIAKKIGLGMVFSGAANSKQAADFINAITRGLTTGDEINSMGISGVINAANVTRKKSILATGTFERYPINPNTKVEENVPLSRFNGKRSNVFESDRMTGAFIADNEGNKLFNFFGGIFYPVITGKWWASNTMTKASGIARNSKRDADGYIYGTPIIMKPGSQMSNNDMLLATLELMKMDALKKNSGVTKAELMLYIEKAFDKKKIADKKNIIKNALKRSNNIEQIFDELEYALFQEEGFIKDRNGNDILNDNGQRIKSLTFEERKEFVSGVLGDRKVVSDKFPSAGSMSAMAEKFTEPETQKSKNVHDIVIVYRTKGELVAKKSDKKDSFYHKSYPYEIAAINQDGSSAEIEVFILDGAYNLSEAIKELTKSSGDKFSYEEYYNKIEQGKYKSEKVALAQYGRTAKLSYASGEIYTPTNEEVQQINNITKNEFLESKLTPTRKKQIIRKEAQEIINNLPQKQFEELRDIAFDPAATPKKTVIAYKLFKVKKDRPGQVFPLFVNANEAVPTDVWMKAVAGPTTVENGKVKVKSKLGGLAYRPGWHSGNLPLSTHIGERSNPADKKMAPDIRPSDQVWAEIEVSNDVDWQTEATKRAKTTKKGTIDLKTAHITDQLPVGGHYKYKTNSNMTGEWLISGEIKLTGKILTDEEVAEINSKSNTSDLKRLKPFDYEAYGFTKEGYPVDKKKAEVDQILDAYFGAKERGSNPELISKIESITKQIPTAKGGKIKFQKAPKILGVNPTVVIVNDEQKALVDQIKLEIRAQREQKKAHKQVLANISARVTALKSKGNISVKQFDAIMKNLNRLNFDNETKVQAFIDYVSRALANADYVEKVARAQSLNKKIKKSLKGTANPFAVVAKMFTTLDSRWVDNIDDHIAVAQMILDGVKPSTARRGVLTLKEEPDLQIIAEYIDKEQKAQTQMMLDRLRSRYEMITGKSAGSLDAEAMIAQLDALNPNEDQTDKIKEQIDQKFAEYASMLSEEDPQVIVDAVNVDTDMITWRESVKILDALDTYFTNGSTAGIDSLMGSYQGIVNAKRFKYKSNPMTIALSKTLAKLKFENFTGFTRILERKFRSLEKSLAYEKASGINDIVTGVNRADFEAAKKQKEYVKKFEKVKDFNSNENIYERGVIADLIRTNAGIDQDAEFDRLVNILIDSKDMLLASQDQTKVEMGKLYDKVFKKLGLYKDGITIDDVLSKATKTNIDAVKFAVDMFADKYDLLSDTALGVYNVMLGQDINYTPKTYMNIRNEQSVDSDPLSGKDSFSLGAYSNAGFNKNEAGVLMPITRPKDLKNAGKYVDLNFDNNMFRSYRLALTDAYTAKSIRQLNSFFNTKENEDILASEKDFDVIKAALSDYINTAKGKNFIGKITSQEVDKFLNLISTFGSVRALVGVGQALSQFASGMSNTIINAGEHIRPSDFTKKTFEFMNRSGQPIANVGENDILISLANFDKAIERATVGKNMAEIGLDKFAKFNSKAFQIFVSNPDAAARRLAWMAYYRKYISKNNLGPIDLNGEPNADAAAYAQGMVDRSMDATDARIRGDIYRTQNVWAKAVRGMLFPFSSFGMNQKTRMWGDLTKLVTFNADFDTARSLASIGAEMFVYNLIRYQMGRLILYAAMNMLGYDDEEQDELYEELKRNMISSSWNKAIVDTFSPLALFDNWTLELANWMMATTGVGEPSQKEADDFIKEENDIRKIKGLDPLTKEQEERKRDQYMTENSMQFYISNEANWGVLGIQFEKASESYEIYKAITTGKYTDEYGRDVYFDSEAREKLKWIALLKTGGQIVPLREIDQVANKSLKFLKKGNTMSEKKYDMITEVKRKFGKVDPVLEKLAEKKNKITTIENEIAWINEHGGLKGPKEKMEYAKLLDLISTPSKDMLEKIQRGGTAQEIFDQELKK